mmetsp:Transcript_10416/g.31614  ORF Transcript_10416/g.31614 Transcript_10416/m.31614 type:complete len:332 (-) Transcript_10416:346-1341(-)
MADHALEVQVQRAVAAFGVWSVAQGEAPQAVAQSAQPWADGVMPPPRCPPPTLPAPRLLLCPVALPPPNAPFATPSSPASPEKPSFQQATLTSRSTSRGSSTPSTQCSDGGTEAPSEPVLGLAAEPEGALAEPYIVRNTFIDVRNQRAPSLEDFFQERRAHSCPAKRVGSMDTADGACGLGLVAMAAQRLTRETTSRPAVLRLARHVAAAQDATEPEKQPPVGAAPEPEVRVVRLADVLRGPRADGRGVQDSCPPGLPSIGSAGHFVGECKPCAFVQKGCMSGVECKFCHLCECGEKKRRKKEKVAMRREANKYRLAQSSLKWGKSASVQW